MRRMHIVTAAAMATVGLAGAPRAPAAQVMPRIEYRTTGGFAAIDNTLTISGSGRAVLSAHSQPYPRRKTFRRTLSHAAHARLLRLVRAVRIERLARRYRSKTPVADGITTTLRFRGFTVTVEQESNPPAALERAFDALNRLASSLPR